MADYRKMYCVVCKAADEAATALESVPGAEAAAEKLIAALREAEEIYIMTDESER